MTANKPSIVHPFDPATLDDGAFDPNDDAPDLSTPFWVDRFAKAKVQRGRPKSTAPKIPTTLRLDPDILTHFRATGPGWQSRINEALRRAAGLGRVD